MQVGDKHIPYPLLEHQRGCRMAQVVKAYFGQSNLSGKLLEDPVNIPRAEYRTSCGREDQVIFLQEQFAVFAANFVRWAARWLTEQCPQIPSGWQNTVQPKIKEQVKVAAHTSAWVNWQDHGCLLMFTDHSLFAGLSLSVKKQWGVQLPPPFSKSVFLKFRALCALIAQNLR
jgi:hypothetical protein